MRLEACVDKSTDPDLSCANCLLNVFTMSQESVAMEHREISSPRVGKFNVYIQGSLKSGVKILTVHDLGCNHTMWERFVTHPDMLEITKRVAWIHVDVPGQEDNATDLKPDYKFPSMKSLGEDIVCVLDQLDISQVVCLGEGAGANIVCRFAMAQPNRVMGVCLLHCTGTSAGFMESLKDKVINWKLDHIGMNPTAETYLVLHRFGSFETAQNKEQLNKVIESFQLSLRSKINAKNLRRFVESFLNRTNITDSIGKLKCPALLVTGSKASFNHTVHTLHQAMLHKLDKKKVELLEMEGVANVLEEKTRSLAESFLYFLQGVGAIGGVPMPRMVRQGSQDGVGRSRSRSMEEADQPRGIYSTSPVKGGFLSSSLPKSPGPAATDEAPETNNMDTAAPLSETQEEHTETA